MTDLTGDRIRHTVVFTLSHPEGSAAEADFLAAAGALSALPGVEAFQILRETSPKNAYRFGISMEFAGPAAYDGLQRAPRPRALRQRPLARPRCPTSSKWTTKLSSLLASLYPEQAKRRSGWRSWCIPRS